MKFLSKTLAIVALPFIGYLLLVVTPALAGHLDSKLRLGHHLLHTPASFLGGTILTAHADRVEVPELIKRNTQSTLSALYFAGHPATGRDLKMGYTLAALSMANYAVVTDGEDISLPSVYIAALGFSGLMDSMCEALSLRDTIFEVSGSESTLHEMRLKQVKSIFDFANKGASHPIPLDFEAFREWWFSYPESGGVACAEEAA